MKITRKQIRRIIKEAMDVVNVQTGEVIPFGDDSLTGMPDAAVPDLVKRLSLDMSPSGELSNADFKKLEAETIGKQDARFAKKKYAQMTADRERLNIENLLGRLEGWAKNAANEYSADNPGVNIEDVAMDLAAAAEHSFEPDEWEELRYYFDNDDHKLNLFTADSM